METNKELINEQPVTTQPDNETQSKIEEGHDAEQHQNHHNSAAYAASLWHSPVKHTKPQHRSLDL